MARPTKKELDETAEVLADFSPHDWHVLNIKLTDGEWAHVYAYLVRRALRMGRPPWHVLREWTALTPRDVEAFLVGELDKGGEIPPETLRCFVDSLLTIGNATAIRALERIRMLAEGNAAAVGEATIALEILGAEKQDRIEAMAAEWRRTRSYTALRSFYHQYIDRLPEGTPFGYWAQLLGHTGPKPTVCYCFTPASPDQAALFVETDQEDRLLGCSLKD